MNQLVRAELNSSTAVARLDWNARQLVTIKQTVAKDCNDSEFNLFMEFCRARQLDPFLRQAIAIVFNKDNQKKRQMTIIVTQDGLRVIASRCGDYRPAEDEPAIEYDESLKGQANPLGIVKCTVRLWKQDRQGAWHPVNGTSYWDEFAPIKTPESAYEWVKTGEVYEDTGKDVKRRQLKEGVDLAKSQVLEDGNWKKMGRIMIAKCATMQALRAGWPEAFSGVYGEEEMDRARVADQSASELVAMEEAERRAKAVSMSKDEYPWVGTDGVLHFVPAGQFFDHVVKTMRDCPTKADFDSAKVRNREGLQRFWAMHKSDALDLNAEIEKLSAALLSKVVA